MPVWVPLVIVAGWVILTAVFVYRVQPQASWHSGWGNTVLVAVCTVVTASRYDWIWLILLAGIPGTWVAWWAAQKLCAHEHQPGTKAHSE